MIGKIEVQVGVIMLKDWIPRTGAMESKKSLLLPGELKRHVVVGKADEKFVTVEMRKSHGDTL
jgi:hypothetical protein